MRRSIEQDDCVEQSPQDPQRDPRRAELERLASRLESELEDALKLIRSRDYCRTAAALEATEHMAAHLAKREEQIDDQRQRLKLAFARASGLREPDWRAGVLGV